MQQYLYLTRHAHALSEAPSDEERPLSPKGQRQTQRLAKGLRRNGQLRPEEIWHSGLIRARETAEGLKEHCELGAALSQKDGLAPSDGPEDIAARLDELDRSCLVVGHEPNLSYLTCCLLRESNEASRIIFSKASMLCLSRLRVEHQATPWLIEWHISHSLFKKK